MQKRRKSCSLCLWTSANGLCQWHWYKCSHTTFVVCRLTCWDKFKIKALGGKRRQSLISSPWQNDIIATNWFESAYRAHRSVCCLLNVGIVTVSVDMLQRISKEFCRSRTYWKICARTRTWRPRTRTRPALARTRTRTEIARTRTRTRTAIPRTRTWRTRTRKGLLKCP